MQKEIEIFEFFTDMLKSKEKKKILFKLTNFHDNNLHNNKIVKKYYDMISTPFNFGLVLEQCKIGEKYRTHLIGLQTLNKIQEHDLLRKLKVFEKDKFYDIFTFFKKTITNSLTKINKEDVDKILAEVEFTSITKNQFISDMYIIGLNNLLIKNYDLYVENTLKKNDYNVEEKYNQLVNKIKKYYIENLKISNEIIEMRYKNLENMRRYRNTLMFYQDYEKISNKNKIIEEYFENLKNVKPYYKTFRALRILNADCSL